MRSQHFTSPKPTTRIRSSNNFRRCELKVKRIPRQPLQIPSNLEHWSDRHPSLRVSLRVTSASVSAAVLSLTIPSPAVPDRRHVLDCRHPSQLPPPVNALPY